MKEFPSSYFSAYLFPWPCLYFCPSWYWVLNSIFNFLFLLVFHWYVSRPFSLFPCSFFFLCLLISYWFLFSLALKLFLSRFPLPPLCEVLALWHPELIPSYIYPVLWADKYELLTDHCCPSMVGVGINYLGLVEETLSFMFKAWRF